MYIFIRKLIWSWQSVCKEPKQDEKGLFMGNNRAEVIQTRSPFDRRRVEDRRLFLEQEHLDLNPERRVNMIKRRMFGTEGECFLIL